MGQRGMAPDEKKARRLKAFLVFLDESGLLMAPLVRRSWSPRGCTPVLYQKTRSHRKVSAVAALCVSPAHDRVNLYFRLHPDANINADLVLHFLKALKSQLKGAILLIWDRFLSHRARKVTRFIQETEGFSAHFLPPYAPELNPVENVWAHLKMNSLVNWTPMDLDSLADKTRRKGRSIQRKEHLLRAFIEHTPLSLRLK